MYRGDSLGGLNEFDEFSVVGKDPQLAVKAGEAGTHGDGTARGVKVKSGRGGGGGR